KMVYCFFSFMLLRPPISTLFPYTTLFRSDRIFDYQEFMESFAGRPTLDQLVEGVATQIAQAFVGGFLDLGLSDGKGSLDLKFVQDRKSTRLNSSHVAISYAVFCLKKKKTC